MKIITRYSVLGTQNSFTLIEFLVVLGVISIMLPAIFTLFFTSITSQQKAKTIIKVKQNGDNAMSTMEYLIKNKAISIYDNIGANTKRCLTKGSTYNFGDEIAFEDISGNRFGFNLNITDTASIKIASTSATSSLDLTGDAVTVTNMAFSCTSTSDTTSPIVSFEFTVAQKGSTLRHENKSSLKYATSLKLRN